MPLIILAHPTFDNSFANKTIIEELQKSDLEIEIKNIYNLYPDYKIDVTSEQEALLRHQTIVFQYPLYWLNVPAILKLWIDEVFQYGFAYGPGGDKLKNKDFLLSFTTGAVEAEYKVTGKHHLRIYEFCKGLENTAMYAQMNYKDPFCFYGTASYDKNAIRSAAKHHAKGLITSLKALEIQNTAHPVV
jgi:putative NADPH-quinone reductase